MSEGDNEHSGAKTAAKDIEPYRRLVNLQKQMIELAQQHELTKRRRDSLREQITREAVDRRRDRRGLRYRFQQAGARFLKQMARFVTVNTGPGASNHKLM